MLIIQIVAVVLALVMLARALNLIMLMRWYTRPLPPGKVEYVNDKRMYYTVKGTGAPAIIIESSLASSSAEWWPIQDQLSAYAPVFTYDRAGYGWSELVQGPRSSRKIAHELRALLDAMKIPPPYILVGHSQGGLYVNHFCRIFPDTVKAVVFIDPMSPDDVRFRQELLPRIYKRSGVDKSGYLKMQGWLSGFGFMRVAKLFLLKTPAYAFLRSVPREVFRAYWNNVLAPKTYQAALNEYAQLHDPRNNVDLKNSGDFPSVPLRVLVHNSQKMRDDIMRHGDLSRDEAEQVERLWQELMRAYGALSPLSKIIEADTGSHHMHLVQPEVIVQTILDVLQESSRVSG
jgi:pimeloyl-ACP methyl ester carboxylesterase